jgi:hypothetical protein
MVIAMKGIASGEEREAIQVRPDAGKGNRRPFPPAEFAPVGEPPTVLQVSDWAH